MNKKDAERLKREITKEVKYDSLPPASIKARAKERFYRRLEDHAHLYDKEYVMARPELMCQLAGTERILDWLKDDRFSNWWWDEHVVKDELMSMRETAVSRLKDILTSDEVSAADALKAARMIFELTDQFPSKKQEVKFLDQELNNMDERAAEHEIRRLHSQLRLEEES